jgi:hypothetical protein
MLGHVASLPQGKKDIRPPVRPPMRVARKLIEIERNSERKQDCNAASRHRSGLIRAPHERTENRVKCPGDSRRSGDYRVNFRDGNEITALEDSVNTAVEMARKRAL